MSYVIGGDLNSTLWTDCLSQLEQELSDKQLNTWIRPLQLQETDMALRLLAPNRFVLDFVRQNFLNRVEEILAQLDGGRARGVFLVIGSDTPVAPRKQATRSATPTVAAKAAVAPISTYTPALAEAEPEHPKYFQPEPRVEISDQPFESNLNPLFTFDTFVEGKSNQFGRAAALQISENPGTGYNPLFIYGGVGLGKTHLMHAVGNTILAAKPNARIAYLHSEKYVREMVRSMRTNTITEFKQFYRSLDALLVDDIQFFAGKGKSQEEFFHNFNSMMEGKQQMIFTCDRYPKDVDGLEDRLKSRFGWGLTVCIDPPELETRVAILHSKAEQAGVELPTDVAFFIGKRVRSNVRELEGALRRVIAESQFSARAITIEFTREALRDLISVQDKQITIENIQKTVCEYYKLSAKEMLSKKRTRSIARPRQVAMALTKEMTTHSLPEIGDAFGGRDHTTVLHACRTIEKLRETEPRLNEDFLMLVRTLEG
ncbi:MAG: chromosomal replication initiator protein DnaA [Granulosicoccaceae bacterium]